MPILVRPRDGLSHIESGCAGDMFGRAKVEKPGLSEDAARFTSVVRVGPESADWAAPLSAARSAAAALLIEAASPPAPRLIKAAPTPRPEHSDKGTPLLLCPSPSTHSLQGADVDF